MLDNIEEFFNLRFDFAALVILLKRNVCLIWPNFRKSLGPFGEAEIAEYRKHVYRAEMTGDAVINVFWSVEYLRKNLKNLIVIGYLTGTDAAAKFCGYVENRQNLLFGISEAIGLRKVQKVGMFICKSQIERKIMNKSVNFIFLLEIVTPSGNSLTRIGNTYIGPKTADYVQCICSPEMSEFGKGHSNFYFVNYKPQRYRVVSNYQSKTLPNFKTILVIENPFWPIIIATIMEKVIIIAKEGTNGEMLESPFRKLQEDEVQMGIYADKTRAGDFNVEIKNMDKLYQHVSHFIQGFVYQY